ncbi:hypothetical protein AMATHDRAFT_62202 [Amanita thiersii Skay4041]|uniref:Peptidase M43 pregnancy-associated plasma-A domain-containing protein n=1 Tax=Amanita thiersii Skay4041 TaxID=703135 RepID=A0A2A9NKQ1_9AGAR|nr:hypothetical protein AMATHDRAFT_62202 [Amanita thiersii Skay4041]
MRLSFITLALVSTLVLAAPQVEEKGDDTVQLCATHASSEDYKLAERAVAKALEMEKNSEKAILKAQLKTLGNIKNAKEDSDRIIKNSKSLGVEEYDEYDVDDLTEEDSLKTRPVPTAKSTSSSSKYEGDSNEDEEKPAIPIVRVFFNIVMANRTFEGGNIPDQMILRQMIVLNDNYRGSGLTFKLAGVTRILNLDWFTNVGFDTPQEDAMKRRLHRGDATTLNVYTVGFVTTPGLLGYATFPWSYKDDSLNDGVVLLFKSLPGGGLLNYNLGRTLVHEVGHWLGLFHTFEGGCFGIGDGVADTPPEAKPAVGCPVGRDTCRSAGVDPIHNYMDYTFDACQNQFTRGQIRRARQISSIYRGL